MPQSPINIINAKPAKLLAPVFHYPPFVPVIEHTGLTVQINKLDSIASDSFMQIGEKFYDLVQFHFHEPSEHHIEGQPFALEAHFLHFERGTKSIVVVGIMIEEGAKNPFLEQIAKTLSAEKSEGKLAAEPIDPLKLFPQKRGYYRFMGSLTTEPYLENVLWIIMTQPITASAQQIEIFAEILKNNSRELQPLKNRSILVCDNCGGGK